MLRLFWRRAVPNSGLPAFAHSLIAAGFGSATPVTFTRDCTLGIWAGRMALARYEGSVRIRAFDPAAAADRLRALRSRQAHTGRVAA